MSDHRTFMAKKGAFQRGWYVVDATDKPLGRLAAQIAMVLMGKHKPTYTPHVDTGDFVIVVNAEKVKLTGRKVDKKVYRHSGYPGGLKETTYGEILAKHPERLIEKVVKGMVPRNKLQLSRKLKVYAGPNHPHAAQKPAEMEV
ncbi:MULTISPECIES: 50S ribosomal protein L13 [Dethiosulfovibrio]|jgi:large subunit ribosomal protein L13|uniref:Large ribosomal subunit protein uL13 n=2 Tax=Dethiosulfovibrio TaxID=47054 RepID=A0ABS9ET33_9BACT|nr:MULTISPECIES: 50S ribosomal protein L13 [Dethiosulfovibrio]MEA3284460.1 50S ribosomal protein L13 [Synergistota bacterium]MCF4114780.1 50S ribosomal protein L13 [Dethiosulfovibrio russensis]MCF4143015.1 50S ribosomal protein L13 [Dethiosulfovibrio marinus]MCF4145285.1 50S ribosomal protein L13 [Dethiosulfovibrio acidaminovorans]MCF4152682.1 50S ribosomal protein L13 [Dethiosulfovibrio faecalis]